MKSSSGLKAAFLMYTAHFCLNILRIFYKECMESYSSLILLYLSFCSEHTWTANHTRAPTKQNAVLQLPVSANEVQVNKRKLLLIYHETLFLIHELNLGHYFPPLTTNDGFQHVNCSFQIWEQE